MVVMFIVARRALEVIATIPDRYYQLLPVSNTADFDLDGILDYIDDSDGDGIADADDATPYGRNIETLLERSKFLDMSLPDRRKILKEARGD